MFQKWSKDQNLLNRLESATKSSATISEALNKCDLVPSGANYKGFKDACKRLNIDTSHFLGQAHMRGKSQPLSWNRYDDTEKILVKDSPYLGTNSLKKRLLKEGRLIEVCAACSIGPVWQNTRLVLQLDHINGVNNDNRIENLRLLCPNCHSQTRTYCGKNVRTG